MRYSTYLEVNLSLLQDNLKKIQEMGAPQILPMVKADAYGNGLVPISQFLSRELNIKKLGCATLGEAVHLYRECPDLKSEMIIFSDTEVCSENWIHFYENLPITPVLHQASDVDFVLKNKIFKDLPLILKVNTGMNRLGISLEELDQLAPRLKGRGVEHLMTHFACSYYPLKDGDKTHRQMEEFKKAKKLLNDHGVEVRETSVSNSGAIEQKFGFKETYIRPGLMLYGPPSVEPYTWDGHQISKFVTKILKTFEIKKGTPVGYGINVVPEDGYIAIIPVGYADLSVTTLSGVELLVNGVKGKIFARVNMDMSFIFFPIKDKNKIKNGDVVEIWNHDNRTIAHLADQAKTIPYHLMCAVTNRIQRNYKVN
jgi:alanine racemase